MRGIKKVTILTAVIFLVFTAAASAQEQEGFIKRLFFRLRGEKPKTAAVPVEEKTGAAAVTAVDVKPSPQDETVVPAAEEKKRDKRPLKEITTKEFAEYIKEILDYEDEALAAIPELKKDEEGFYAYNGVRLEDLEREKLDALFSRIQNELNRIRIERISQQFESMRQAQQARSAVLQSQQPQVVAHREQQMQQAYVAARQAEETNVIVQRIARTRAALTPSFKQPQIPQPAPGPSHVPMVHQQPQPPPNPPQDTKQPPQPPTPPRR